MSRMGVKQTRQLRALVTKLEAAHSLTTYAERDRAVAVCLQDLQVFIALNGAEGEPDVQDRNPAGGSRFHAAAQRLL